MVVANSLYIQNSKVNNLGLYGSKIDSDLSVNSTHFTGVISAKNVNIGGSLFIHSSNIIGGVFFQNGKIGRTVESTNSEFTTLKFINSNIWNNVLITDVKIAGALSFNSSSISSSLLIRDTAYPISESSKVKIIDDIDLIGSTVEGNIEIQNKRVSNSITADRLRLAGSLFINTKGTKLRNTLGSINLRGGRINSEVEVINTDVKHFVKAISAKVNGDFSFTNSSTPELKLSNSFIASNVVLNKSILKKIMGQNITVSGSMFLRDGHYGFVDLFSSNIVNTFTARGSFLNGDLKLNSSNIGSVLLSNYSGKSTFKAVDLNSSNITKNLEIIHANKIVNLNINNSTIGNNLRLSNSNFSGDIWGNGLSIGGSAFIRITGLRNTGSFQSIDLSSARINNNLHLYGVSIDGVVNLTNTNIKDSLLLTSSDNYPVKWENQGELLLRKAHVGNLFDSESSWLNSKTKEFIPLDLSHFTYDSWGLTSIKGAGDNGYISNIGERNVYWLTSWLEAQIDSDKHFNPQPYRTLAESLEKNGYYDKADEIIVSMKDKKRLSQDTEWWERLFLLSQKLLINYGFNPFRTLFALAILFVLGLGLSHCKKICCEDFKPWVGRPLYILKLLTPGISSDGEYNNTWFEYIYRVLGFIILSFLIAGLSGLVK